ncbi:unnamed protein product [Zymoseptoria tritici ST99CH_3D7]|uniref:BZIP domain-containing protein n=1 Tax=Zymoseptoria tritici (strain ST99CH_3D7) TaxID=1276538 RepID=A0A1X7RCR0_ZYMT9|nr:unnamed protein product [Zymoseptoria tritici ST99CH_3D7]
MSPAVTSKRKRRSKSDDSEDVSGDESKKRGRPRVERPDGLAADRRRTQIRMAQRAYRQRKESTMDELRNQVSDLTSKLALLNKAFGRCREQLTLSGLRGDQAQLLRATAQQFDSIVGATDAQSDGGSPPALTDSSHASSAGSQPGEESSMGLTERSYVPYWLDKSTLGYEPAQATDHIGIGYQMQERSDLPPTHDSSDQDQRMPDSYTTFRVEVPPEPQIMPSLRAARSYATKELTFGRYLHRAAIEKGYQLLLEPDRWPTSYERVFKLSLMSRDRNRLLAGMRRALSRTSLDDLDSDDSPLVHVGGAGTHYPRRDRFGTMRPRKKTWNLGIVGPQALAMLDDAAQSGLSVDMTVEIAGFEGEWFDPYDVEGYLAEKGINLDPASPYAVIELPDGSESPVSVPGDEFSRSSESVLPYDHEQLKYLNDYAAPDDIFGLSLEDLDMAGSGWAHAEPRTPLHLSDMDVVKQHQALDMGVHSIPLENRQKKTMIIDVAKFVKALIVTGRCLSRSPGYRRHEVDRALELAAFEPFPSVVSV